MHATWQIMEFCNTVIKKSWNFIAKIQWQRWEMESELSIGIHQLENIVWMAFCESWWINLFLFLFFHFSCTQVITIHKRAVLTLKKLSISCSSSIGWVNTSSVILYKSKWWILICLYICVKKIKWTQKTLNIALVHLYGYFNICKIICQSQIYIVACQWGGVSKEPLWPQAATRHGPVTL